MAAIYHDNGRAFGRLTRFFRDTEGGVEWMFAADYAAGSDRWFFFYPGAGRSVEAMMANGYDLRPADFGNGEAAQ